ncbi:MAG: glycoside hydrolase family 43 protein [Asticcacaulis sp.]
MRLLVSAPILCLVSALGLSACADKATTPAAASAALPFEAPLTMPDMPLHDPFIVADKKTQTYYLFTSNRVRVSGVEGVGVMAYKSRDLKHWSKAEVVFKLPEGIWADGGGWAPEVHEWQGKYYLFVTAHNEATPNGKSPHTGLDLYRRSTILAVSDSLDGPFTVVRDAEPVVPKEILSLDGTLFQDAQGKPWMVYAHEWIQTRDGGMAALPLNDDLSAKGPSITLFKGSDSEWSKPQQDVKAYVTDGPQLRRTQDGSLIMIWSSWGKDGYFETQARSKTGELQGPWEQLPKLLDKGSGHGMLFDTFEGQPMLIVHRPFGNARGKLYEVDDSGDRIVVTRQRVDLDGDANPVAPYKP